jgi:hypothetical protein
LGALLASSRRRRNARSYHRRPSYRSPQVSEISPKKYTVAVDFDGVIHSYTSPWINEYTIPDAPVDGAAEWLNAIRDHFEVVIFTTRGKSKEGRNAVLNYLDQAGVEDTFSLVVTDQKPPALVYLDDRALRFDGQNFPTAREIHQLKPWNK